MKKIGFIGVGNMGEALLAGILRNSDISPQDIIVYGRSKNEKIKAKYNVEIAESEAEVAEKADIIWLGVKPYMYFDMIGLIKPKLATGKILVSMAPGITVAELQRAAGDNIGIIRTSPNLPVKYGAGCVAYSCSDNVDENDKLFFNQTCKNMGYVSELPESYSDIISAATGAAPAFVFVMCEALADGAVRQGLPRGIAYDLVAQMIQGAGTMLVESIRVSGTHPGALKDSVCSPGGTTIEGIATLERNHFRAALIDALGAVVDKSRRMKK